MQWINAHNNIPFRKHSHDIPSDDHEFWMWHFKTPTAGKFKNEGLETACESFPYSQWIHRTRYATTSRRQQLHSPPHHRFVVIQNGLGQNRAGRQINEA